MSALTRSGASDVATAEVSDFCPSNAWKTGKWLSGRCARTRGSRAPPVYEALVAVGIRGMVYGFENEHSCCQNTQNPPARARFAPRPGAQRRSSHSRVACIAHEIPTERAERDRGQLGTVRCSALEGERASAGQRSLDRLELRAEPIFIPSRPSLQFPFFSEVMEQTFLAAAELGCDQWRDW